MRTFSKALATLTLGATLAFGATAAQASTVILDVGTMQNARTVNIAGLGNVMAAPMQFKATYDGKPTNLLAWCVDVYHSITVQDYSPNLTYTDTNTLSTDFNGHALDNGDVLKIGLLANYGQEIFDAAPVAPAAFTMAEPKRSSYPQGQAGSTAYNNAKAAYNSAKSAHNTAVAAYNSAVSLRNTRLSAVQGAIWQVASNRNVSSNDGAFDLLVDNLSGEHLTDYFTGVSTRDYGIQLITPVQQYGGRNGRTPLALTQSFVFATGAVPEPSTWALLILGFGGAGAMLRRQRRAMALAA